VLEQDPGMVCAGNQQQAAHRLRTTRLPRCTGFMSPEYQPRASRLHVAAGGKRQEGRRREGPRQGAYRSPQSTQQ
jgi:hypothetical protein